MTKKDLVQVDIFVVTKDDGIVFKLVYKQIDEGNFLLVSSNPDYSPYKIPISHILEIWQFETYNSFVFEA